MVKYGVPLACLTLILLSSSTAAQGPGPAVPLEPVPAILDAFQSHNVAQRGGKRIDIPKDQWRTRRMDEQFDALIYLGPPSAMTRSRLASSTCADSTYINTRLARMALVGVPTEALKQICGIAP